MRQVEETGKTPLTHICIHAGLLWSLLVLSALPHSRLSWSRQAQSTDGCQLKSGCLSAASPANWVKVSQSAFGLQQAAA